MGAVEEYHMPPNSGMHKLEIRHQPGDSQVVRPRTVYNSFFFSRHTVHGVELGVAL